MSNLNETHNYKSNALKRTFDSDYGALAGLEHFRFIDSAHQDTLVIITVVWHDRFDHQRVRLIVGRSRDPWIREIQRRGLTSPLRRRHGPAPRLAVQR